MHPDLVPHPITPVGTTAISLNTLYAHILNLVLVDSVKSVPATSEFFALLKEWMDDRLMDRQMN